MEVLEDSDDDHSSETNENETNENDPLTLNPVIPRPKRREIRPPTFTGENNIDAPKMSLCLSLYLSLYLSCYLKYCIYKVV